MRLLDLFKSNASKVAARLAELQTELEAKRQRLEELQMLPLPPAEGAQFLTEIMTRNAARHEEHVHRLLKGLLHRPFSKIDPDSPGLRGRHLIAADPGNIDNALQYFFGTLLRAEFERIAQQLAPVKYGPPRAERVAEIATLEKRIAELVAEEKETLSEFDFISGVASQRGQRFLDSNVEDISK
jgi:hypothetical protein